MSKQEHAPGRTDLADDLFFDGERAIINTPDENRPRVCTFEDEQAAKQWGALFAAAPELLELIERLAPADCVAASEGSGGCDHCLTAELIARATGEA